MTVADRVTLARTKRGFKKADLAAKADISSGYLTQLENPRPDAKITDPKVDTLQKLATALEVPFAWLAFGTEPEPEWPVLATVEPTGANG